MFGSRHHSFADRRAKKEKSHISRAVYYLGVLAKTKEVQLERDINLRYEQLQQEERFTVLSNEGSDVYFDQNVYRIKLKMCQKDT